MTLNDLIERAEAAVRDLSDVASHMSFRLFDIDNDGQEISAFLGTTESAQKIQAVSQTAQSNMRIAIEQLRMAIEALNNWINQVKAA